MQGTFFATAAAALAFLIASGRRAERSVIGLTSAANAAFQKQHPGVDVNVQYQNWGTHLGKFDATGTGANQRHGCAPFAREDTRL